MHRQFSRILDPESVIAIKAEGHTMYVPAIDLDITAALVGSHSLDYERLQARLIRNVVKPSMTALDIGANIGYYSLMIARGLQGLGQVYAFEPERFNFRLLNANVKGNGYANIAAARIAISDVDGEVALFKDLQRCGAHSLWQNNITDFSGLERVPAITLDSFTESIEKVDLVKMDIQGAEGRAIRGAERLLSEQHPIMFFELSPHLLRHAGDNIQDIVELLESWGYQLKLMDEARLRLETLDVDGLESKCDYPYGYVNVIAKH